MSNEVIIDGVNVAECEYYYYSIQTHCNYCNMSQYSSYCNDYPDCHFKQLQRAKAENEKLKADKKQLLKDCNSCNFHTYKQALKDIKEILNNYMGDGMVISFNNTVSARNMIKDKLYEVLND